MDFKKFLPWIIAALVGMYHNYLVVQIFQD
jgi:hypothetical protein